ncbi:hypothetical protein AC1031_010837 [Aphanomyces cochlioides]|nr:hypothetical protein AC1031_010837 [Aphanomyces cochlioides]
MLNKWPHANLAVKKASSVMIKSRSCDSGKKHDLGYEPLAFALASLDALPGHKVDDVAHFGKFEVFLTTGPGGASDVRATKFQAFQSIRLR